MLFTTCLKDRRTRIKVADSRPPFLKHRTGVRNECSRTTILRICRSEQSKIKL